MIAPRRCLAHVLSLASVCGACVQPQEPARPAMTMSDICPRDQTRLLLEPRSNSEMLLGLSVDENDDGQLIIADERKPGCIVRKARKVQSQWDRRCTEESVRMGAFSAGARFLANLQVQYESQLLVESSVSNKYEIVAELEGECGERVITSVLEGTGRRSIQEATNGGGSIQIGRGALQVQGGGSGADWQEGDVSWSEVQAWGIRIGPGNSERKFINFSMPSEIVSGQTVFPTVDVHEPLWLIAISKDADGNYWIVFPSPDGPDLRASSGAPFTLPPVTFTNSAGRHLDEEEITIYGFREKADYDYLRPDGGRMSVARVNQYTQTLMDKLEAKEIPASRWVSERFHYRIVSGERDHGKE